MVTEDEAAEAWSRIRIAMERAGLVIISTEAIAEMQRYSEEVACPYCTGWNHVSVVPDYEIIVDCIECGKKFTAVLVQYIVAEDMP